MLENTAFVEIFIIYHNLEPLFSIKRVTCLYFKQVRLSTDHLNRLLITNANLSGHFLQKLFFGLFSDEANLLELFILFPESGFATGDLGTDGLKILDQVHLL